MKTESTTRCNRITLLIYWEKLERAIFTNLKDLTDSKRNWKTFKPNFNGKGSSFSKIILSERVYFERQYENF